MKIVYIFNTISRQLFIILILIYIFSHFSYIIICISLLFSHFGVWFYSGFFKDFFNLFYEYFWILVVVILVKMTCAFQLTEPFFFCFFCFLLLTLNYFPQRKWFWLFCLSRCVILKCNAQHEVTEQPQMFVWLCTQTSN